MPKKVKNKPESFDFSDVRMEMSGNGKNVIISLHGLSEINDFSNSQVSATGKDRIITISGRFIRMKTVGDGDFVICGKVEVIRFENTKNSK